MKYRTRIYYTEEQKALMWVAGKREIHYTRLRGCLIDIIRRSEASLNGAVVCVQRFADARHAH